LAGGFAFGMILKPGELRSITLIATVMPFYAAWALCVGKRHLSGKQAARF